MKVVLTTLNAKFIHSSLALRCLKEYCSSVCPDIVIKEYTINNELLPILGDIYQARPDVLGVACYIWNIEQSLNLIRLVKKVLPKTVIILGGPEVSYDPVEIMRTNVAVDYIIQGEGEEVLADLLGMLRDGWPIGLVPGLARRCGGDVVDSIPQVVNQLDTVPFAYDEMAMSALKDKIVYYESSRGCPFSCQYCLSGATRGVRFYSLERVIRDLAFFISHGVRQVKFVDRTFNARREHYWPILRFLAAADCQTNFHFEIAADLLDDEMLAFLQTVPTGRFQFEIGVQSTNPATLTAIARSNNWPVIVKNVEVLRGSDNIHLHLDLIAGLPYEDFRRFGQSFNDVYSLQPHMLQLGFLKLLKGSGVRRQAAEHDYVYMDTAPYEVLANKYLTYAEIRKLKILEDLFSLLYNSGRFRATLAWFVAGYGEDAFRFYDELTGYWEVRELHLVAHGSKALYQFLADYCLDTKPGSLEECHQLLKFDALVHDRGSVRPEFLPWNDEAGNDERNAFWRDAERVHKYLPGYKFTNWRELKKKYHIEVFPVNIPNSLDQGTKLRRERTVVLFSYTDGNPTAQYQIINPADFWLEGSE